MIRYLARRLLQAVFVVWAAFTLSFLVLYLLPGDPVLIMAGGGQAGEAGAYSPEQVAELRHDYGFDRPLLTQYLDRLLHAVRGDFGRSVQTSSPAGRMVLDALPNTLALTGAGLALAVLLGSAIGLLASLTRSEPLRRGLLALPGLGVSLPSFWVGLMLLQAFSFHWHLAPSLGGGGFAGLVLPALTLCLPATAAVAQVLATGMLDELGRPYADTARAKGAGRLRVHFRHALRLASLPPITILAVLTGGMLANAVIVETVFARDGVGRIVQRAVSFQDIPVVQAVVVLSAVAFAVVNLLVDLFYPLLDPRTTAMREGAVRHV
ncbi:ABC transporter permease [Actinomadura gamaensis]|uniref:ABC transporter permease n=1 Tax=Actinomadura gamaensis TaxID=1763541 RepID=A0ABV9TZB0_9ACTN